jgi:hypothetical protein
VHGFAIAVGDVSRRKATIGLVIVGDRQRDLLEVSDGVCRAGGVSCIHHRPAKKGPKGTYDEDHDRTSQHLANPSSRRISVATWKVHGRIPIWNRIKPIIAAPAALAVVEYRKSPQLRSIRLLTTKRSDEAASTRESFQAWRKMGIASA